MDYRAEISDVNAQVKQIIGCLCDSLSGDVGQVVQAIAGRRTTAGLVTITKPAANPLGWVPELLAVCCHAYGQPIARSAPVSACLVLLGMASSALDAVQDDHADLLGAYTIGTVSHHAQTANSGVVPPDGTLEISKSHPGSESLPRTEWDQRRSRALVSNAGVALTGLAWQALYTYGPRYGIEPTILVALGELLASDMVQVCQAQHLDLILELDIACAPQPLHRPSLTIEEYDQLIAGKAGLISASACEAAAVVAGTDHHRSIWRAMGLEREMAKQVCDDYIDLEEDIASGRQAGHCVLYALSVSDPDQQDRILTLLDQARKGTPNAGAALQTLLTLVRELGADYYWFATLATHRNRALAALEELQLPEETAGWIYEWILRVAPMLLGLNDSQ